MIEFVLGAIAGSVTFLAGYFTGHKFGQQRLYKRQLHQLQGEINEFAEETGRNLAREIANPRDLIDSANQTRQSVNDEFMAITADERDRQLGRAEWQ